MKDYKTMVVPVVGAGVLAYETISGHKVDQTLQNEIVTWGVGLVGFGVTLWGIWKSHIKK